VRAEIVHDDGVARPQLRDKKLLDIGQKHFAIDGPINDAGSDHAALSQSPDEGRYLPVTMRHGVDQSLATWRTSIPSGHVGRSPGLIEKDQLVSCQLGLVLAPLCPRGGDIKARLSIGTGSCPLPASNIGSESGFCEVARHGIEGMRKRDLIEARLN
jgi:hypothetical protein